MKKSVETLLLPEGDKSVEVMKFDQSDGNRLCRIYDAWRELCENLKEFEARATNLPEGLSEIGSAMAKEFWRVTGKITKGNSSFDCYDPNESCGRNRIQIKASSTPQGLTSFGPKSQWDRIFFMDFYREGRWDKTFDIYELRTADINSVSVNAKQTFTAQQAEKRRPRFSIHKKLISQGKYLSKETFQITDKGVTKVKT